MNLLKLKGFDENVLLKLIIYITIKIKEEKLKEQF
jgi:hypothetical protein